MRDDPEWTTEAETELDMSPGILGWMRQVSGETVRYGEVSSKDEYRREVEAKRGRRFRLRQAEAGMFSKKDMEWLEKTHIGNVWFGSAHPGSYGRLIQMQPRQNDIPAYDSQLPITFVAGEDFPDDLEPYIPGCVLSARNLETGYYGFREVADDPYRPCKVLIADSGKERLAGHYRQLGLHAMAEVVEATAGLQVGELAGIVRQHSDYVIPDSYTPVKTTNLEDFARNVKENRLQTQCTVSAHFLRLSLKELFGKGCAGIVSGYTSDMAGIVDGVGHAQTVFHRGSQRYIIDATPAFGIGGSTNGSQAIGVRTIMPKWQPLAKAVNIPGPVAAKERVAQPEPTPAERIALGRKMLESQLCNVFHARGREQLYQKLVGLPPHDPARRAVELFMQATTEAEIDEMAVERYLRTLDAVEEASPQMRQRLRLDSYGPQLVGLLRTAVGFLASR